MPDGSNMPGSRDMLPTLVKWFEDAETATQSARDKAERDRDYYDGKQLTVDEVAKLEARGQPPIVINRVRRKIDYLQGLEKQSRQDPKAYGRNPEDNDAADAATDALRFVVDTERFPQTASRVWENEIIEGAGAVDVCVEQGGPVGYRIKLHRIPWDRLFWDPHSAAIDFSDAKYIGMVMWLDEEDVLDRWPDAADVIESAYASQSQTDTYDDRPKFGVWADGLRKRVRIAQVYWNGRNGWQYAAYTQGGFLDEAQPSPYVGEDGEPVCPIIAVSGYIDRDNNRYGVVRDMIDPQDEINKRRSKALHLLSVRQVIAEEGAVRNVDDARKQVAMPDGYLEVAPGMRFEIQQTNDLAAGQAQLLSEAKLELDGMGPNAAMQGKHGGQASGRAIALSQQGGQIEVAMLLDAHRDWKRRVYEAIWLRVRQFWTAETWVRVTDDEEKPRFVGLNVPVTLEQMLEEMDPREAGAIASQMGLQPGDPRLAQVMETKNRPADTMVDIVVDEAPDVITLQQETFATLAEISKGRPDVPFDVVIEAAPLRAGVKQKILKRLRGEEGPNGQPPGPPPPPPEIIIAQQKAQIDAEARQAEAAQRDQAEAAKMMAQREVEMMKADTQREIEAMRLDAAREMETQRSLAEDRRKAAEEAMKWEIALLKSQDAAAAAQASQDMERERMASGERAAAKAMVSAPMPDFSAELGATLEAMLMPMAARIEEMAQHTMAPREIVRDPKTRRAIGLKIGDTVRPISRAPDGTAIGIG